jgi:hypothetical protein
MGEFGLAGAEGAATTDPAAAGRGRVVFHYRLRVPAAVNGVMLRVAGGEAARHRRGIVRIDFA